MTPTTSSFFPLITNLDEASDRFGIVAYVYYKSPLLLNNVSILVNQKA